MSRKVIGIVVALALASVGTVALVSYVRSAEERAQAGEELVEVYVLTDTVPALIARAARWAVRRSEVNTEAARPYAVSFAMRMPSSG